VVPTMGKTFGKTLLTFVLAVLSGTSQVRADQSDDQFTVAANHYAAKRWKLAVEEFRTFLDLYPDHPKATGGIFLLAESALQLGDNKQAHTYFRRYLERQPKGKFARVARFRAGESAYLAGEFDAAKTDLMAFRTKYPEDKLNAYALTYLGDISVGRNDSVSAAAYFRESLAKFPNEALADDCRFGLARALEQEGSRLPVGDSRGAPGGRSLLDKAERLYQTVAGKAGALADDAQFRLGAVRYALGKYKESIDAYAAFETRFAESPWEPKARMGRGWTLMKLDRMDEAKAAFKSLTTVPGMQIEACYWLGIVQGEQGDWPAAATAFLGAVKAAEPGDHRIPSLRFQAGDALRQAGRMEAASEQFDLILGTASPDSGAPGANRRDSEWIDDAMHGRIRVALETDDHQTVERMATRFAEQYADSPLKSDIDRMLAQSRLTRKEHAGAVKFLEPLVAEGALDEQGLTDRYLLAQAYEGVQRHEDALAVLLPVLDAAEGTLKADAQLSYGTILVAMGKFSDAIKPLEAFLGANPSGDAGVKGRGTLAISLARANQLEKAKKLYAELIEKHSGHELLPLITEQLAEAAYAAEDRDWSAELFERLRAVSDSDESEKKGLAGQAWSHFKAGRLREAADVFDELLKKNPPDESAAEATFMRGVILEQLGQTKEALAMYDRVSDEYAETRLHAQSLLAAARLRVKLGRAGEAAAMFERLANRYPDFSEMDAVLYGWAWALHDSGKKDKAVELFERVRKQYGANRHGVDATFRLAQWAFDAGDYARANGLIAEVLAAKPDDDIVIESALYLRGRTAVAEQKWAAAAEAFGAFLKAFPESSTRLVAEFWMAEAAYRQGEYDSAGKRFGQLAEHAGGHKDPWLAMVPLRRAQVLSQQGKWNDAYALASKIEGNYPEFSQQYEADYLIGCCLQRRADFQAARKAFQKVIRSAEGGKTETAAMAQWRIGETYFHQKNYQAALKEYLRVEAIYAYPKWQAGALLQAGKCFEKLGEKAEAEKLYRRVLDRYADTPFAGYAENLLKSRQQEGAVGGNADLLTPEAGGVRQ